MLSFPIPLISLSEILMLTNKNNNVNVVLFLRCSVFGLLLSHSVGNTCQNKTHFKQFTLPGKTLTCENTPHTHTLLLCTAGTIYEGRYERFCRRETLIIMFINRGNGQLLQLIYLFFCFHFFFVSLLLFSLFPHFFFYFFLHHYYVYFLYLN